MDFDVDFGIDLTEEQDKLPESLLYPDYHLNVPLRTKFFEWYRQYLAGSPRFDKLQRHKKEKIYRFHNQSTSKLLHSLINPTGGDLPIELDPSKCFVQFFQYWETHNWNYGATEGTILEDCKVSLLNAFELFHLQEQCIGLPQPVNIDGDMLFNRLTNQPQLMSLFFSTVFFRNLIISMNQIYSKTDQVAAQDYKYMSDDHVTIFNSSKNLTACTAGEGAFLKFGLMSFNLNREGVLCLSDLVHQRFNILVSSFFGSLLNLPQYPSITNIRHIFNWGDKILMEFGQEGYQIIKQLEPVCTSVIIERNKENVCDNNLDWHTFRF